VPTSSHPHFHEAGTDLVPELTWRGSSGQKVGGVVLAWRELNQLELATMHEDEEVVMRLRRRIRVRREETRRSFIVFPYFVPGDLFSLLNHEKHEAHERDREKSLPGPNRPHP
jgi:hypothetical protein